MSVEAIGEIKMYRLFGRFDGRADTRVLAVTGDITPEGRASSVIFKSFADLSNGNVQVPSAALWSEVLAVFARSKPQPASGISAGEESTAVASADQSQQAVGARESAPTSAARFREDR